MIITYIMLAVYILALLYIGFKDHKTEDKDGFIIADRKVGFIGTLASSSASIRDGGGLTTWIGLGFALGYGLYHLIFGAIIAFFLLSLLAPKVRRIAKEKKYLTMGQMARDVVGVKFEKSLSLIILLVSVLGVSMQFYVLGSIVSILLNASVISSIIIAGVIVAFYVSSGGYQSIIRTDILQFFIMLALFVWVFFIPVKADAVLDFGSAITGYNTLDFWAGMIYIMCFAFSSPDIWQRMFSSKDDETAKNGIRLIGFSILLLTLPLTFIGMSARGIIPADTASGGVFTTILQSGAYPKLLISYLTIVGVSITMSTLDTYVYTFSSSLLENFLKISSAWKKTKYIFISKIVMISMIAVSALLALFVEDVIKYLFNILSLMLVMAPAFIFVAFNKLKHRSKKLDLYFSISILTSFLIGVFMFAQGHLNGFVMMLIPVALSTLFMSISYAIAKYLHKI